jgi:phenylpropionate dioxygenase-like ring-hydroxylating dioxygenase large terminal subunit
MKEKKLRDVKLGELWCSVLMPDFIPNPTSIVGTSQRPVLQKYINRKIDRIMAWNMQAAHVPFSHAFLTRNTKDQGDGKTMEEGLWRAHHSPDHDPASLHTELSHG